MKIKYSAVTLLLLGGLASTALAQDFSRVQTKTLSENGTPYMVRFRADGNAYKLAQAGVLLRDQLQLTSNDQLLAAKSETDALGYVHEKYQQYYKGIKVEHGTYSVHARQGDVASISGQFEKISGLNSAPALTAADALQRALAHVGAHKYMWQDATEEAGLKRQESNPDATYQPQGELVIMRTSITKKAELAGKPVLAWKFNVYAQQPVSRAYIYVDAHTGEVVAKDDIIKHAAATGTFATAYSGSRSLANATNTTGGYYLREATRGGGIETYNCRKGNSYTNAVDFNDADNSWTAAEYANAALDNTAFDAHFGAQATYDYWKNVHGRNSYNNADAKIKSYVHFDDTPSDGVGYENAYWNGSVMTYGDGATRFRPLTSLDVCAHEIGHAVCSSTANLTYANESGAMNEGFSDIWGAAVEAYAQASLGAGSSGVRAKSTWLIGEEIDKVKVALRSMSDPNSLGQPSYYKGLNWYSGTGDNGGVHTNSGVLNYWFYLISAGKTGTNEKGAAFSVDALGIVDAAKIAYRAETVYLTASSTYASARTATITSAKDLYGVGSTAERAVTNAWAAVGVGAAYSGGATPPPATVAYCASKGTSVAYEWIDYVALGSIARTSAADAGYYNGTASSTSVAAGSSQTISFSAGFASTAYNEYVKVYIDYNQDGDFTDPSELVVSAAASSSSAIRSSPFTVPATAKTGATRLRVVLSDAAATTSCNSYSYGETEDYTINITGGAAIAGATSGSGMGLTQQSVSRGLELYPNPATDVVRISMPDNAPLVSVTLTDLRGAKVAGLRIEGDQLNVSALAKGIYTLTATDGQKVFHQRFIKQ